VASKNGLDVDEFKLCSGRLYEPGTLLEMEKVIGLAEVDQYGAKRGSIVL
jgi:hypothetical protein